MKYAKKALAVVFWLLILALLVAPIGLIVQISREEMQEFATPDPPVLQEMSIGGIYMATRASVSESFQVSGTFVSGADGYMELDYETVKDARWNVGVGSEVQEGMVIGTVNGEQILATMDGIVKQMHISQGDCFVKLELFTPVLLQTRVDKATLSILRNSRKLTVGKEEAKVSLAFASCQQNSDGTFNVLIAIDSDEYTYGQVVSALHIKTGRSFDNVVSISNRCVYQKGGSQWYARQVSKDGFFIKEVEIEVLYQDEFNAFVSGINDGEYFDSGYQIIAGG